MKPSRITHTEGLAERNRTRNGTIDRSTANDLCLLYERERLYGLGRSNPDRTYLLVEGDLILNDPKEREAYFDMLETSADLESWYESIDEEVEKRTPAIPRSTDSYVGPYSDAMYQRYRYLHHPLIGMIGSIRPVTSALMRSIEERSRSVRGGLKPIEEKMLRQITEGLNLQAATDPAGLITPQPALMIADKRSLGLSYLDAQREFVHSGSLWVYLLSYSTLIALTGGKLDGTTPMGLVPREGNVPMNTEIDTLEEKLFRSIKERILLTMQGTVITPKFLKVGSMPITIAGKDTTLLESLTQIYLNNPGGSLEKFRASNVLILIEAFDRYIDSYAQFEHEDGELQTGLMVIDPASVLNTERGVMVLEQLSDSLDEIFEPPRDRHRQLLEDIHTLNILTDTPELKSTRERSNVIFSVKRLKSALETNSDRSSELIRVGLEQAGLIADILGIDDFPTDTASESFVDNEKFDAVIDRLRAFRLAAHPDVLVEYPDLQELAKRSGSVVSVLGDMIGWLRTLKKELSK